MLLWVIKRYCCITASLLSDTRKEVACDSVEGRLITYIIIVMWGKTRSKNSKHCFACNFLRYLKSDGYMFSRMVKKN